MVGHNSKKGICQLQPCEDAILEALFKEPLRVGQLVEKIQNSKTTVLKYYHDLMKNELIQYKEKELVFGRQERILCLTEKGRKKAKTKQFVKQISEISDEFTEHFILNYKNYVMNRVKSSLFFPYNTSSRLNHGIMLPTEYKKDWCKWTLSQLKMTIHPYPEIERLSQALETDLTKHGFTDEEILKLWIIGNGLLMMKAVKAYGAPMFFGMLPFKFPPIILSIKLDRNDPEVHKREIKETLKNFNADNIQTETNVYDLFP